MANENNNPVDSPTSGRPRRGSFTSNTFNSIFGRSNSVSGSSASTGQNPFPGPISTAAAQDQQRRRMSINTLGLSGTSPSQTSPFSAMAAARRGSVSTAGSDSIDENAIDDDDGPARNPNTPFTRRMSYGAQALRASRAGNSSPGTSGEGLNWSEQFRSRAESSVSQRPTFSTSPSAAKSTHDRAKSVSEMPAPPTAALPAAVSPRAAKKPDAFGERMLKGDFYMD